VRVERWLLAVLAAFAVCGAGDAPPPRPHPVVTDPPRVLVSHPVWEQQAVAGPPFDTELYYDRVRGKVRGVSQSAREVFEWDGAAWGVAGPLTALPVDGCSLAAFDPDKDLLYYLCHDAQASAFLVASGGATWTPRSLPPSAPLTASLGYDEVRKELLLFGSSNGAPGVTWTAKDGVWTLRAPASTVPAAAGRAMAFDARRGVTVMLGEDDCPTGGGACAPKHTSEIWEWNGATWTHARPPVQPPPRLDGKLAYDAARARTVLFGGTIDGASAGDTWEWDGVAWHEMHPSGHPPDAFVRGFVFDRTRARTLFLGSPTLAATDTWLYWSFGDACAASDVCDTALCDEGVCCTVACGTCERCDDKGTGCTVVRGRDDPGTCDGARTCDPDGACRGKGGQACAHDAECASRECSLGVCCDSRCAPFGCSGDGACKTRCASGADCAPGAVCRGGVCLLPTDTCTSTHVSASTTGASRECAPYGCNPGAGTCRVECTTSDDCAAGFLCDAAGTCTTPTIVSGGCAMSSRRDADGLLVLVTGALALGRHRRRRARGARPRAPG
jgi:hypothetical protein